ncbi:MAG: VTT domain-containing protein [Planctomycetota bacterium]
MANRWAKPVAWIAVLIMVAAVVVLMGTMPVDRGLARLDGWISGLGPWGPFAYGLLYAVAVVLLVPGWTLTVAAGALFGPGWGVVAVSWGSTLGAALAFLIARYAARRRVAKMIEQYPRFNAIDKAISHGGWRIVALLRLTPVVPFNLSNYAFGLTAIRFWPYVLASWLFMLPGAFMYIFFGHVGGEGVASASGAGTVRPATWVAWGVGLAATVVLVAYVSRLALKMMREQTAILDEPAPEPDSHPVPDRWPWKTTVAAALALVLAAAAGWAHLNRDAIRAWGGPRAVAMVEVYDQDQDGPRFDHRPFDVLLRKHVDKDGGVDYSGLAGDTDSLDQYLAAVRGAPFDEMGRDEKLTLLINAYNAFTLRLILDHYPVKSIKDIPAPKRWDDERWNLGGHVWSLNQIEHEQIRPKFKEPRIHFALVCAAVGCPKLRNEAYAADRLEAQLEDQTRYAHGHDRWLKYDRDAHVLWLTKLYDWYGGDFKQAGGSVMAYAAKYSPELGQALEAGRPPKVRWLDYDWTLNDKRPADR